MSKFIESIETLTENIEDSILRAMREMEAAEARFEAFKAQKKEITETLREVARGGEPEIEVFWIEDSEGNRTDLYAVFTEALEAEGGEAVEKAAQAHLEAISEAEEERFIDECERSRADYIEEDNDWE